MKVSHIDVGSTVEFDEQELLDMRDMFGRESWRNVVKVLECIKENAISHMLKFAATENELRNAQGAVEMIGTLMDMPTFNDNALSMLRTQQEAENK